MSIISAVTGISPKFVALGFEFAVIAAVAGGGYLYVTNLQSALVEVRAEQAKTQAAFVEEKATAQVALKAVSDWQAAQAKTEAALEGLAVAQRLAGQQTRRLNDVLSRHDLATLGAKQPDLVAGRINAGSADVGRLLEQATAAGGPDPDRGR